MPDAGVPTASFRSPILEYLSTRVLEFSISYRSTGLPRWPVSIIKTISDDNLETGWLAATD